MRKLTDWISESFIWGVGITRPRPEHQRRAAQYITGMLLFVTALAAALFAWFVTRA